MLLLLLVSFCPQRWRGLQHFERAIDAVDEFDFYGSGLAPMSTNAFVYRLALAAFQNFGEVSQRAPRRVDDNEKRAEGRKRVAQASGFYPLGMPSVLQGRSRLALSKKSQRLGHCIALPR